MKKRHKPSAAAAKPPTQIIAGFDRDPFTKAFQGLLKPSDDTLQAKGQGKGLAIYDEIERDCHAYAVIQKRKHAVVSFPWEIDPATDSAPDAKAADGIREILESSDLDGLTLGLLDAILKGYAAAEVVWDPETWLPAKFCMRGQRRFLFDQDCAPRLLTPEAQQEGVPLPERKFIFHRFGAKDGNPYGLGLGTRLFWPAFFKRKGLGFWLAFAEKFGGPTVIGKYPQFMEEQKQIELLSYLSRASQETAIVVPLESEVQLLEAAKSGSIDTYEKLVRYMDEEMSKAVLGETLTTSLGDAGSYAASQTHDGVRMELIRADADLLSATLNGTLLAWLTEFHFPGAAPPRIWRRVEEAFDAKAEAEKDSLVFNMGFEPDEAYIQEKYGAGWHRRAQFGWGMEAAAPAAGGPGARVEPEAERAPGEHSGAFEPGATNNPEATGISGASIQDAALNGAQVTSLLQVLEMVANGSLPKESASQAIKAAFPSIPDERVQGMIAPIEVKGPEPGQPPMPAEFAERAGRAGRPPREKDDVDRLADQLEIAAGGALGGMLEPVKRLAASASSYEEVIDGLADCYADTDASGFAEIMKDALAAASLAGALSVGQRNG